VYLPRVKYEKKSSGIKECYENLNFKTRSKHAVRAFMRVSKNISPLQKFLAARYNFEVPEGHTFVQPHYRGETTEQKIIYRSRSAMQMIFNKEVGSSVKTNNYFQFEVDVKNLFKKNKYDVKHYSANKRNDGGIDVVATKNLKDKQIIYLIQCKCYKKIKIGPDIVRELAGSMIGYGDECKGIVITTSKFTQDAELERKKLAQQNIDISFIDGEKFVNLIRSK
jgi:restriction endonuclease Mrr